MWTRWTLAGRASLHAATFDCSFHMSLDTNKSSLPSQMLHKSFNNCPSLIGTILWIFILTFATSTYHLLPPPYATRCEGEFKSISCSQFHTTACAVEHPTDRFLASGQRWWVNQLRVLFFLLFRFIQFFSARIFGRIPNMSGDRQYCEFTTFQDSAAVVWLFWIEAKREIRMNFSEILKLSHATQRRTARKHEKAADHVFDSGQISLITVWVW